jgi:hypothetical protein
MTIRMARRGFTSQSKVRVYYISRSVPFRRTFHLRSLSRSFTSSTYIRLLLRFTYEQGRHRRRTPAKVQVPRQLSLDDDGG